MSIRIDKITTGRFGNKILQYNSLIQLKKQHNISCSFVENNEISCFFKDINTYVPSKKPIKLLTCNMILRNNKLEFDKYEYKIDDPANCLHNVFYKITRTDPRKFLKLKDEFQITLQQNTLHIGIHIRGGDKLTINNGNEIHEFKYYKDSIDYVLKTFCEDCKNYNFWLCTDDTTFDTYKKTHEYLAKITGVKIQKNTGNRKNYIKDWAILSQCDILINSSSTFCVTAGFLGKTNKYIIHSKIWLNKCKKYFKWNSEGTKSFLGFTLKEFWATFDDFWIDSLKQDKTMYKCDKLI